MNWTPVWHQAITRPFAMGMLIGEKRTVVFRVNAYADGTKMRIRFRNIYGQESYEIGEIRIINGDSAYPITKDGERHFFVPVGEIVYTDECPVNIKAGDELEVRLYYVNKIQDNNMTEEEARLYEGNHCGDLELPEIQRESYKEEYGLYDSVPSMDQIELCTEQPARVIAAFGDSITAMNRWVKPLQKRLFDRYGTKYALMNAGISGNCLLHEGTDMMTLSFGQKGVDRFERDVLAFENLDTVILALGVNDVAYFTDDTKDYLNYDAYVSAITSMTETLHQRGVRVVMQTLSPRKGYPEAEYTPQMEELRLQINDWIRSCGLFDYMFDADAVVRDPDRPDCYNDRYHQGDHLHPSQVGGDALAAAYDLEQLTGEK